MEPSNDASHKKMMAQAAEDKAQRLVAAAARKEANQS